MSPRNQVFGLSGRTRSVYKTCERQAACDTARGMANFPDSGVSKHEYRISCGCEHPFFSFLSLSLSPLASPSSNFPISLLANETSPCIVIFWMLATNVRAFARVHGCSSGGRIGACHPQTF